MPIESEPNRNEPYESDRLADDRHDDWAAAQATPTYEAAAPGAVPPPPPPPPQGFVVAEPVVYAQPGTVLATGQLPVGVTIAGPGARLGAFALDYILRPFTLYIGWLIWAIIVVGQAQTPGKGILNQRVIDSTTLQPVGFARMFFMRGIVAGIVAGFAILFTLGIILFMPLWDKNSQNIWDKVSGTYVVSDPLNAWRL